MTTKHDVLLDMTWKNINQEVGLTAGVPLSIQNKSGVDVLQWVGQSAPASGVAFGIVIPATDFSIRTMPVFPAEFMWMRVVSKPSATTFIGVYADH